MTRRIHGQRRRFLGWLATSGAALAAPASVAGSRQPRWIRIQSSPLVGFQFHQGEAVWPRLRPGQRLTLVREPGNAHDPRAVRVDWRGYPLGYLPRDENAAVAQMLDHGECLHVFIARLRDGPSPWDRIELEVWLEG